MEQIGIEALKHAKQVLGITEAELASLVGVKQPSVNYILREGKKVPAEWCIPIEKATAAKGETVTRHQLRPDLYPIEETTTSNRQAAE